MKISGSVWPAATVEECVAGATAGDQRAYAELFERYRRFAWGVARSVTSSHQAAEEATVDGFAAAFRSLGNLNDPARFPSYLAACVRNEVLQAARRHNLVAVGVDRIEELGSAETVSHETPEVRFERSEEGRRALAAFRRLDDRQREAILLVDVEGVPPSEVAATFGITANALHQLLHRAREALRHRYVAPPISEEAPQECRTCNDKLGIYLAGRASVRVISMVDRHTSTCAECQARLADAREVNDTVRSAYGMVPVGLGALLLSRHGFASGPPDHPAGRWRRDGPRRSGPRRSGPRRSGPRRSGPGRRPKGREPGAREPASTASGAAPAQGVRQLAFVQQVQQMARLPLRLLQAVAHPVGLAPLSSIPIGATLGLVSTTMTTLAAVAASVPLAVFPGGATATATAAPGSLSAPAAVAGATRSGGSGTASHRPTGSGAAGAAAGSSGAADSAATAGSTDTAASTGSSPHTVTSTGAGPAAGTTSAGVPAGTTSGGVPAGTTSGVPAGTTSGGVPAGSTSPGGWQPAPPAGATSTFPPAHQPAALTSGTSATFAVGQYGTFVVHGAGSPEPALIETGPLPPGVTFTDEHNGTGVLAGVPAGGGGGSYSVAVTAANGVGSPASQTLTLTVQQAPAFVAGGSGEMYVGESGTFDVHATGYPDPSLSVSGSIPGVTFTDDHGGTGILAGSPSIQAVGVHTLTFTASNGVGPPVTMSLQVTVGSPDPVEITSSPVVFCRAGQPCRFEVTASGSPPPALSIGGQLPPGLTFVDGHDGTGTIGGTPTSPSRFGYSVEVTASNGVAPGKTQWLWILVLPSHCWHDGGDWGGC